MRANIRRTLSMLTKWGGHSTGKYCSIFACRYVRVGVLPLSNSPSGFRFIVNDQTALIGLFLCGRVCAVGNRPAVSSFVVGDFVSMAPTKDIL